MKHRPFKFDRRRIRRVVLGAKHAWLAGALAMSMLATVAMPSSVSAAGVSDGDREHFRACERQYRDATKQAKAAAPAGFVPAPDKDRRPNFLLNCLASK